MITVYLDMDGVIADFVSAYQAYDFKGAAEDKFPSSVMEYQIFKKLRTMPGADDLLRYLKNLVDAREITVTILSSLNTTDFEQSVSASQQKKSWLMEHGIEYDSFFVTGADAKQLYATKNSILIDDTLECITPFVARSGAAVHHTNAHTTVLVLAEMIKKMKQSAKP